MVVLFCSVRQAARHVRAAVCVTDRLCVCLVMYVHVFLSQGTDNVE